MKGSKVWDVDGNEYVDYVGLWGFVIIGVCDDEVKIIIYYECFYVEKMLWNCYFIYFFLLLLSS